MVSKMHFKRVNDMCFHPICKLIYALTLKKAGGSYVPTAQEIACHFSQDHARVLKLLDFFKNDVGLRVKESF